MVELPLSDTECVDFDDGVCMYVCMCVIPRLTSLTEPGELVWMSGLGNKEKVEGKLVPETTQNSRMIFLTYHDEYMRTEYYEINNDNTTHILCVWVTVFHTRGYGCCESMCCFVFGKGLCPRTCLVFGVNRVKI